MNNKIEWNKVGPKLLVAIENHIEWIKTNGINYEFNLQMAMGELENVIKNVNKSPLQKKNNSNYSIIPANCRTDDGKVSIDFDAVQWFRQATFEEIRKLILCEFMCDYPADAVAHYMADIDKRVDEMFTYLEIVSRNQTRDFMGFECRIDKDAAWRWLKKFYPNMSRKLERAVENA